MRGGKAAAAIQDGRGPNPVNATLYRRLRENGKKPKFAIVAVSGKMLTMLNAMMRDGTVWRETAESA